jgi:hypothetical protein
MHDGAIVSQSFGRLLEPRLMNVGDDDFSAFLAQAPGDREADPCTGRRRHDGAASFQETGSRLNAGI